MILMPTTEILQRKGLKTGIGRALVPSDSTKLQALSCHAFSEFLTLVVVQNRAEFTIDKALLLLMCSWLFFDKEKQ